MKSVFESQSQDVKDKVRCLWERWNKAVDDGKEPELEELDSDNAVNNAEGEEEECDEEREEKKCITLLNSYRT